MNQRNKLSLFLLNKGSQEGWNGKKENFLEMEFLRGEGPLAHNQPTNKLTSLSSFKQINFKLLICWRRKEEKEMKKERERRRTNQSSINSTFISSGRNERELMSWLAGPIPFHQSTDAPSTTNKWIYWLLTAAWRWLIPFHSLFFLLLNLNLICLCFLSLRGAPCRLRRA